jgi:hypothetical protein
MGTTLTGTTPQDTYDSLIKVTDNGPISGTAKYLSDGLGNDSILALSTARVGVGTSSPSAKLDVALPSDGTAGAIFGYTGGSNNPRLFFNVNESTSKGQIILSGSAGALDFGLGAGGAEIITLKGSGNVGIGTSSPATKLEVNEAAGGAQVTISGIASTEGAILNFKNRAVTQFAGDRNIVQIDNYLYDNASTTAGGMTRIKSGHTGSGVNSSFISFSTSPNNGNLTERVRVTNDGLTFNGDTAAANALDDYEEGTFTPTAYGATSAGTTTYNNQNGYYTKIGRMVNVSFFVSYSALTGTGSLLLGGLPFAISNSTQNYPIGSLVADGLNWTGGTYLQAIGLQGETNIAINYIADDASVANQQCVNEAASLRINLTYFV